MSRSLYHIPEGCICQGDGLNGMLCEADEHAVLMQDILLAALKKCEHWMSTYSPALCSDSLESARAAIAKAEGR